MQQESSCPTAGGAIDAPVPFPNDSKVKSPWDG